MPFNPASSLAHLLDAPVLPGRITWIGLRPAHRAPVEVLQTAELTAGLGMAGDRYSKAGGARQVTLIAAEAIAAIAAYVGREVDPAELRRNFVTTGINLFSLKGRRFRVGTALLEHSGECHPCSRMEETLGVGGYNAVRGLGGLTARVIESGEVRLGDPITRD